MSRVSRTERGPAPTAALLFERESPHGLVVGVRVAQDPDLDVLAEEERVFARGLAAPRRSTFVAGRLALQIAIARRGLPACPALRDDRGAPSLAALPGASGSISHKDFVAVALLASSEGGWRHGVDVEVDRAMRVDVARRVLTDEESETLGGLPDDARGAFVLRRFSAKEAIYKAIDPFVRRYVGFREVSLEDRAGALSAELRLEPHASLRVEVAQENIVVEGARLVLSTARAARR